MKKNVNVFIGVVLCAVLCGTFVWLQSAGDEDTWKPTEIYDQIHTSASATGASYTTAISSGAPVSGGVALSMSSRSSMRRTPAFSYAGAYRGVAAMPLASSHLASSPISGASGAGLHLTSNAEIKSFGGGGNGGAAMGGAIANRQSNSGLSNPSLQGGVGISPIAYSTAHHGGMSSVAGGDLAMMAAENPVMAMTNAASVGMGTGFYGDYSVMDYSSASYAEYTGIFGGGSRMGVRGRRGTTTFDDAWTNWLLGWLQENGYTSADFNGNGIIDDNELADIYAALQEDSNTGMGMLPTEDDLRDFLTASLPVGDIIPLLLIALLYMLFVAIKSNALKSLIKTERSE